MSGPPSRVRKVWSCKVEILIYAWNARENFPILEANISKTYPVTLLFSFKNLFNSKSGMHVRNKKKWGVEFFKLKNFIFFLI